MTREEAIKFGEKVIALGLKDETQMFCEMAIEALQKQIPQQPTIERGFVKCPACKLFIRYPIIERYNNCPECGQALNWEKPEEGATE